MIRLKRMVCVNRSFTSIIPSKLLVNISLQSIKLIHSQMGIRLFSKKPYTVHRMNEEHISIFSTNFCAKIVEPIFWVCLHCTDLKIVLDTRYTTSMWLFVGNRHFLRSTQDLNETNVPFIQRTYIKLRAAKRMNLRYPLLRP